MRRIVCGMDAPCCQRRIVGRQRGEMLFREVSRHLIRFRPARRLRDGPGLLW